MTDDNDLLLVVAADAAKRVEEKRITKRRSGTVVGVDEDNGIAQVLIDGDDEPTDVSTTSGTPVVNDRVRVAFPPPHGVEIDGYVGGGASTGGGTGAKGDKGDKGDDGEDGAPGKLIMAQRVIFGGHSYVGDNLNTPFGGTNVQNGDETRDSQNTASLVRDAGVGNALGTRYLTAQLDPCVAGTILTANTTAVTTIPIPEDSVVEAVYLIPDLGLTGQNTNTRLHQVKTRTFAGDVTFAARQYDSGVNLTAQVPQPLYMGMGGVLQPSARARTTPTSLYAFPPHQNSYIYPSGGSEGSPNSIIVTSTPVGNGLADPGGTILVRLGGRFRNTAQGGALLLMGGTYMGGWGAQFAAHRAPQAFGVECNVTTSASSGATSIAVEVLAAPVPSGWQVKFSNGITATTTAAAATGATSLTVSALSGGVPAGNQGFAKPTDDSADAYLPEATHIGVWGINDSAWWTPQDRPAWRETTRSVIALWSCPFLAPASRRNIVYSGGEDFYQPAAGQWVTNSPYGLATQPNKRLDTVGEFFTLRVAPDFPGGSLDLFFMAYAGTSRGVQMSISVDGGTAKVLDTSSASATANYDAITGSTSVLAPFLTGTGFNLSMVGRVIDHPGCPAGSIVGAVNDAGTAITIWDPVANAATNATSDQTSAAGHIIGYCPMVKRLTGLAAGAHTITCAVLSRDSANSAVVFYGYGIETPTPVLWCNVAHLPNGFASAAITNQNTDTAAVIAGTATPVGSSTAEPAFDAEVQLIDIDSILNGDATNFLADSLHPNSRGHRKIADELLRAFSGIIGTGDVSQGDLDDLEQSVTNDVAALEAEVEVLRTKSSIAPNGANFYGHSYTADIYIPQGTRIPPGATAEENPARGFTHILRRSWGLADNLYHFQVPGVPTNTNTTITYGLMVPHFYGSIHAVHYTPLLAATGLNAPSRSLSLSKTGILGSTFAQLNLSTGVDLVAGVPNLIPRTLTVGDEWLYKDVMIQWLSAPSGTGRSDGGGGVVSLYVNGGDFSNYAVAGTCLISSDLDWGGWGEIDNVNTFRALRGQVWGTVVTLDAAGKIDGTISRSGLSIHVTGYNDVSKFNEQAPWKESLRHSLCACRWMARYLSGHITSVVGAAATITESAGNGAGAAFAAIANEGPGFYFPYAGYLRHFSGAVGGTKPYLEYAIPANYNGEPIDLCFLSEPSRTVSAASTVATLTGPAGTFNNDDIPITLYGATRPGRLVFGTGIPTGTTITSINGDGSVANVSQPITALASRSVTVGRRGGTATVTIDGAAPNFGGGVRINNGTSAAINTDQIAALVPLAPTRLPMTVGHAFAIPVTKRITGLAPGAHTIRVTIDSLGDSQARFYLNGWAREAPTAPQIWGNIPYTPSMDSTAKLVAAAFNIWAGQVIDEFDDVYLADLFTAMSPGGTPDNSLFLADTVHPSWKGAVVIANTIEAAKNTIPVADLLAA